MANPKFTPYRREIRCTKEEIIADENIRRAIIEASKGKRDRAEVLAYYNNKDNPETLKELRQYILDYAAEYQPEDKMTIDDISSGKTREIFVPKFKDQIVHHALIRCMESTLIDDIYKHSYASIPGRGALDGKKYIEKIIKSDPRSRKIKYFLKLDIKKCFPSIKNDVLYNEFKHYIKSKWVLKLIHKILKSVPDEDGLPLGFYTSQWFSNWFLGIIDRYIKFDLNIEYYIRYMDDIVIFGSNQRELVKTRNSINEKLNEYGLRLKNTWKLKRFIYIDKKTKIQKGEPIDFMGYKFFRDHIEIRERTYKNIRKSINKLNSEHTKISDYRSFLSYLGWMYHTDSQTFYKATKDMVDIRHAKDVVSKDAKRKRNKKSS